jgi:asparagine synthase (glutamine-hydrolysing)
MCGIAGIVEADPSRSVLDAMVARLAHRGPDGCRSAIRGGRVGLAHRRLAIIDLSEASAQPMVGQGGQEIIFNGAIYNYLELRGELEAGGVRFRSTGDTEVLLAAYTAWGEDCLARLNGMFSFAIYDPQRGVLFAARDRFGEKPFYYHRLANGGLAFASELKALFAHPDVPRVPNHQTIYRFLRHKVTERDPETFFAGIAALPAAHALRLRLDDGALSTWRYWHLPVASVSDRPETELVDEFRELLSDAIRLRLRADVPVGTSLSGGLDSSAIVGYLGLAAGVEQQHTFSARFPGFALDEGPYIHDAVALSGARGHEVEPVPTPELVEANAWHQDQPFASLSILAQWSVMALAREQGVTVLLDGQGADESLGGYHMYFGSLFRELAGAARLPSLTREVARYADRYGWRRLGGVAYYASPERLTDPLRGLRRGLGIDAEFAAAHGSPPAAARSPFRDPLRGALERSMTATMLPALLRYADRSSMAHAREVRLPYLDHRLVELAFRMPASLKVSGGVTKRVLRLAMRDYLPPSVLRRRDKIGFAPPQAAWLRGPLGEWAEDLLGSASFAQRPWTDAPPIRRAWVRFRDGSPEGESDLWRHLSVEAWARAFLDRDLREIGP